MQIKDRIRQLKRLLDYIDLYSEENAEFKKSLEEFMNVDFDEKDIKPLSRNPFVYVTDHGVENFEIHVRELGLDELMEYARFLKIKKGKKKITQDELAESIIKDVRNQIGHGSVFSKRMTTQQ